MSKSKTSHPTADPLHKSISETKADLRKIAEGDLLEVTQGISGDSSMVGISLQSLPINTALPCTIYLKVEQRFLPLRRQGERIKAKRIISLQERNQNFVFIHKAFSKIFSDLLVDMKLPDPKTEWEQINRTRILVASYGAELQRKIKEPKRPIFQEFQKHSKRIVKKLVEDKHPEKIAKTLLKNDDTPLSYFTNHAKNSAVYGTILGMRLGYVSSELEILAYACMVHDIGNLFLPKKLLYKEDDLDDQEWQLLKMHARRGAEFLQEIGAHPSVVLTALQHHEFFNGTGYPNQIAGKEIHPFARICSVIDTLDAMTSNRPFRKAISQKEAIIAIREIQGQYDPDIVKALGDELIPQE